jgi:hypothetical protein
VIPPETDISTSQVEEYIEAYKSEEPLIKAHSSSVNVGICSPSSFETNSGKWPRSDDQLDRAQRGIAKLTNGICVLLVSAIQGWRGELTMPRT